MLPEETRERPPEQLESDGRREAIGLAITGILGLVTGGAAFLREKREGRKEAHEVAAENEFAIEEYERRRHDVARQRAEARSNYDRELRQWRDSGIPYADPSYLIDTPDEGKEWGPNELTEAYIWSFQMIFAGLEEDEAVFLDQHGRIIKKVKLPADLLADGDEIRNERGYRGWEGWLERIQAWYNIERRKIAKEYPTIRLDLLPGREEPDMHSVYPVLRDNPGHETYLDLVWERAHLPVSAKNKMTRLEYARREFKKAGIDNNLAELLVLGIAGVESGFDPGIGASSAGAVGAWQVIEDLGREIGLVSRKDDRANFERSTPIMARYFAMRAKKMREDDLYKKVIEQYGIGEHDLIFPCLLDSYHAGPARVYGMLQWFYENVSPEKVKEYLGEQPWGRDLYMLMSRMYSRAGVDPSYGPKSRSYYAKAVAMKRLFEEKEKGKGGRVQRKFDGNYDPPKGPKKRGEEPVMAELQEWPDVPHLKHAPPGWTIGDLGEIAGIAAIGMAVQSRIKMSRRALLSKCAFIGAAAATGEALGLDARAEHHALQEPLETSLAQEDIEAQLPPCLNASLAKEVASLRLNVPPATPREIAAITARRNPYLMEWAQQMGIPQVDTDEKLSAYHPMLRRMREATHKYRCMGIGDPQTNKNVEEYMWLKPEAVSMVERIADRVTEEARKAGLPEQYAIRLVVTGAARSKEYQRRLRAAGNQNATENSSHTCLNSVDINWGRIDLVDTRKNTYFEIRGGAVREAFERLIVRTLIDEMRRDRLVFRKEGNQTVFHIMCTEIAEE